MVLHYLYGGLVKYSYEMFTLALGCRGIGFYSRGRAHILLVDSPEAVNVASLEQNHEKQTNDKLDP